MTSLISSLKYIWSPLNSHGGVGRYHFPVWMHNSAKILGRIFTVSGVGSGLALIIKTFAGPYISASAVSNLRIASIAGSVVAGATIVIPVFIGASAITAFALQYLFKKGVKGLNKAING